MKSLSEVYSDKRVLITGDTGFKGTWLVHWLKLLGAEVFGLALPAESNSLFKSTSLERVITHIDGALRDFENTRNIVQEIAPDFVFHLAAQALVIESYESPQPTFMSNVGGTLNVLEAVRVRDKSCSVVVVTTDKCYENSEWVFAYRENDPMGGHDPYSASKGCAELLVASYQRSFFNGGPIRCGTARAGNVIGPGDWAKDRIVPDIMRSIFNSSELEIRNPNSIRPWQHVLEPLSGYLTLGAHLAGESGLNYCQPYNFGPRPESARSVGEIVQLLAASPGVDINHRISDDAGPHEAKYLKLSIDRAIAELNWNPVWDFETTLEKTWTGYRDINIADVSASTVVNQQIESYCSDSKSSYY